MYLIHPFSPYFIKGFYRKFAVSSLPFLCYLTLLPYRDYLIFSHRSFITFSLLPYFCYLILIALYSVNLPSLPYLCYLLSAATGMKWIEAKMQEIGITGNQTYRISFLMDSAAMITVQAENYGVIEVTVLT